MCAHLDSESSKALYCDDSSASGLVRCSLKFRGADRAGGNKGIPSARRFAVTCFSSAMYSAMLVCAGELDQLTLRYSVLCVSVCDDIPRVPFAGRERQALHEAVGRRPCGSIGPHPPECGGGE